MKHRGEIKCPKCYGHAMWMSSTEMICALCGGTQRRVGVPRRGFRIPRRGSK